MRRIVVVSTVILLATACGSEPSTTAKSTSPGPTESSHSPALPNPFAVTARYTAASLGLKVPISRGFAVEPDGNVYVTDSSQRVTAISPQGKVVGRWGRKGTGPGEFHFKSYDPTDPTELNAAVAVGPGGDVYVIDSGNKRVEVFSRTGTFIRAFPRYRGKGGPLAHPLDVAVDPAGHVFVADDNGLSKFSPSGAFEWRVGGPTSGDPDLFGHLHLVDVDVHGRVVVTSEESRKVVYVDDKGHAVDAFSVASDLPAGAGACNATVNEAGDTVVETCGLPQDFLVVYDRSHHPIGAWPDCRLQSSPRFRTNAEAFALTHDGVILKLRFASPDA